MKTKTLILGAALGLALACGCFRADMRTITVSVPQMKSTECSKVIQDALGRIEGVKSAEPDLQRHTMSVSYNGTKLATRNIEYLISGCGFDANDAPANPEARKNLPPACR